MSAAADEVDQLYRDPEVVDCEEPATPCVRPGSWHALEKGLRQAVENGDRLFARLTEAEEILQAVQEYLELRHPSELSEPSSMEHQLSCRLADFLEEFQCTYPTGK